MASTPRFGDADIVQRKAVVRPAATEADAALHNEAPPHPRARVDVDAVVHLLGPAEPLVHLDHAEIGGRREFLLYSPHNWLPAVGRRGSFGTVMQYRCNPHSSPGCSAWRSDCRTTGGIRDVHRHVPDSSCWMLAEPSQLYPRC